MSANAPQKRLALIVNTASGGFSRSGSDSRSEAVTGHDCIEQVWPLDEFEPEQLKSALADGLDGLAIAGGDGTIRSIAEQVLETAPECPLLPLPFGTANILVKRIYGDRDPVDLLDHITGEPPLRFRPGLLNGSPFLVAAALGFPSTVARARERLREFEGPPPLPSFSKRVAASLRQAFKPGIRYQTDEGARRHSASGIYVDLSDPDRDAIQYIAVHWREMGDIARMGLTALTDPGRLPTGRVETLSATSRKPMAAMIDGEPVFTECDVEIRRASSALLFLPVAS